MVNQKRFKEICREIRISIIENSFKAKACHLGSSLSAVEILVDIYFNKMKKQDIFLFGKASGVAVCYSVLAKRGIIPESKVAYYLKHYPLPSREVPGILHSFGSLGHALPVSCGLALTDRTRKVYCLIGDGDVQEGTTSESILFARQHKLKNLKIIVDKNSLQACGATKDILDIDKALELLKQLFPIKVVKTIKGKGVSFIENHYEWHYWNLDKKLLNKALKEL